MRSMAQPPAFDQAALAENQAGRLAGDQRKWLSNMSGSSRRGNVTAAVFCVILGLLLLVAPGPAQYSVTKPLVGIGFLVIAGFLFVRGFIGADPLTQDLRERAVESVEGAIQKQLVQQRSGPSLHYFNVAGKRLHAFGDQYDAAPDYGWVRVYYLPHSKRVANFERLPDRPLPPGALDSPAAAVKAMLGGLHGHDAVSRAEAMAQLQALGGAMRARVEGDATPPAPDQRDPRPLAQAIVGRWSNGTVTVEFIADGTATGTTFGGLHHDGHWSVDSSGRLVADVTGSSEAVDAWVVGDSLTIAEQGVAIKLSRASA